MDELAMDLEDVRARVREIWIAAGGEMAERALRLARRDGLKPDEERRALYDAIEQINRFLFPAQKAPLVVLNQNLAGQGRLKVSTGRDGIEGEAEAEAVLALGRRQEKPRIRAQAARRSEKVGMVGAQVGKAEIVSPEAASEKVEASEEPRRAADVPATRAKVDW